MKIIQLVLAGSLAGCVMGCEPIRPTLREPQNPGEAAYIEKINRVPLEFTVPKTQAEDVWGRAQAFVGQHSSMKIQIATDYILQTYNPDCGEFGYYVTKTPQGDSVQIGVKGLTGILRFGATACIATEEDPSAQRNAHILANYLQTGELPFPNLIRTSYK
jgi:hypothetical protein